MGFAVIDAERDGDDIVLVGPIAASRGSASACTCAGIWEDDKRFGLQVKVAVATPVGAVRRGQALIGVPEARQARRRRAGGAAARPLR